jgi:Glycosyl transferase family 2
MIAFSLRRRGLAPLIKEVGTSGFAMLALRGRDVDGLIAEEPRREVMAQAVEHARRNNERFWMEKCARRFAELDPSAVGRCLLASTLGSVGKLEEAETLLAAIPAKERAGEDYLSAFAVLRAKQGQAEDALDHFGRLADGKNRDFPAPIVLQTAEEMMQSCLLGHSVVFISRLRDLYPKYLLIRSLYIRCLAYAGDIDQARELASVSAHELAQAHEYDRRQMREAAAAILALAGWNNELLDFAADVLAADPTHWAMYYQVSEAATYGARRDDYDRIMSRLPTEHRRAPDAMAVLCRWMIDKGQLDAAKGLIEKLHRSSAKWFLNATLYLAVSHGSAADVKRAFDECVRCGIPPLGSVLAYCMHLYYYSNERSGHESAVDLLARHRPHGENNVTFWQLYLRCLIAADKGNTARVLYAGLPQGLKTSARLQPFAMYFDVEDGRGAEAIPAWRRFIRRSKHVCNNGQTSYPETVSLRYAGKPGAVLLFANVYNGMVYLDWFLDHYRALGVDHFFITDNASDDGTVERLLGEPDVSMFSCTGSFASSAFGVVWTNHQLQRFGVGHWCFHVDVDEGFVFPGHDRGRSLNDLVSYLDGKAYKAMSAVELDMYPERLDEPTASLFSAHRFFDASYQSMRIEVPPYVLIRGGVRQRMTGLALTMTKMPLVRVSPDFRYIECNHHTTHLPLADVSGALLHYKFVGDIAGRLKEAIDRNVHFGGALAYRRLRSAADERGWGQSLLSTSSRSYEGASSLEAESIVSTSPSWESFM